MITSRQTGIWPRAMPRADDTTLAGKGARNVSKTTQEKSKKRRNISPNFTQRHGVEQEVCAWDIPYTRFRRIHCHQARAKDTKIYPYLEMLAVFRDGSLLAIASEKLKSYVAATAAACGLPADGDWRRQSSLVQPTLGLLLLRREEGGVWRESLIQGGRTGPNIRRPVASARL